MKSLFNKVAGVKACHLIKKRLLRRCFIVNFANSFFYRTPTLAASVKMTYTRKLLAQMANKNSKFMFMKTGALSVLKNSKQTLPSIEKATVQDLPVGF